MFFDTAHRLGSSHAKQPRGIFVNIHYYSERKQVRKICHDKDTKKALQDSNYGIGFHRPRSTRGAEKAFNDIIKHQKNPGHTAQSS